MSKFLLLDRDGVINHKAKHSRYVETWDDFVWIDENVRAMQMLSQQGFSFIVITNQAGIGRGVMSIADLNIIHRHMQAKLAEKGILIKHIYVCPHHPDDGCVCRKPRPGMINQALKDYGLKKDQLCFVGDEPTDCQAAASAGVRAIYLGDAKKLVSLQSDQQPFLSCKKLGQCVDSIVSLYNTFSTTTS